MYSRRSEIQDYVGPIGGFSESSFNSTGIIRVTSSISMPLIVQMSPFCINNYRHCNDYTRQLL